MDVFLTLDDLFELIAFELSYVSHGKTFNYPQCMMQKQNYFHFFRGWAPWGTLNIFELCQKTIIWGPFAVEGFLQIKILMFLLFGGTVSLAYGLFGGAVLPACMLFGNTIQPACKFVYKSDKSWVSIRWPCFCNPELLPQRLAVLEITKRPRLR